MAAANGSTPRKKAWVAFPGAPYTSESALRAAHSVLGARGWDVEAVSAATDGSRSNDDNGEGPSTAPAPPTDADLYLAEYDLLPFEELHPGSDRLSRAREHGRAAPQISSYVIRKSLIRKNYLAHSLHVARIKGLTRRGKVRCNGTDDDGTDTAVAPPTWAFEASCADDLDELLTDDLYDVREALEANDEKIDRSKRKWFILKPAMADQGMGIRLFDSVERLQAIFEEFEEDSDEEEDQEEERDSARAHQTVQRSATAVVTSQVRHFVIQEYLENPLLIRPPGLEFTHKFHLRAYVLAHGSLRVFLCDDMLALFAPMPYTRPVSDASEHDEEGDLDMSPHLTNTSRQDDESSQNTVHLFSDLCGSQVGGTEAAKTLRTLSHDHIEAIRRGAADVIGDAFAACAQADRIHFQPWPHAWEIFGVDLMVTVDKSTNGDASAPLGGDNLRVWLLEINAQPDFAKTGARLQSKIDGVFARSLEIAVLGQDADEGQKETSWQMGESRRGMTLCLDLATSAGGW